LEVRDTILLEATRLMAERGYDGTSIQAVADAVGVRKPSVLYHFPSKEELRKAVLDQLLSRWNDILPRLLKASTLTGLAKFDGVMRELMSFFADDPDRARLLVRELLDRPKAMRLSLQGYARPWIEVVAEYIRKGQASGQIRAEVDPEAYVLHVVGMSLTVLASSECMSALLPGTKDQHMRRALDELVRMTRTSLFVESYLEHQSAKDKGVD
jgi:TetR/AcrR family transcriptional regulator